VGESETERDAVAAADRVGRRARLGKWLILAFVLLVVLAEAFTVISRSSTNHADLQPESYLSSPAASGEDAVILSTQIIDIIPATSTELVRVTIVPKGRYAGPDGQLAEAVNLDADGYSGGSITLQAHEIPPPVQLTIDLRGDLSQYPLDRYAGLLAVHLRPVVAGKAVDGEIPTELLITSAKHDWRTSSTLQNASGGSIEVQLNAQRGTASIAFVFFELLIMALLAAMAIAMTYSAIVSAKALEFSLFVWLGAMIFALPAIRNTMPGVPGVGTMADFMVFFWALIAIACCMVTAAITYIRTSLREHRQLEAERGN